MVFAREFPVRLVDLVVGGGARDAEGFVIVVFGSRRHSVNQLGRAGGYPACPLTTLTAFTYFLSSTSTNSASTTSSFGLSPPEGPLPCGPAPGAGRPARLRRFVHRLGQFVAGLGEAVGRRVELVGIALVDRLLGLFEATSRCSSRRRRRSCRDAP